MANFTNGERHYRWRGDGICYSALHTWLRRRYRKRECIVCGRREGRLEWALIPGRGRPFRHADGEAMGSRDIGDYVALCPHCHRLYGKADVPCLGPIGMTA